MVSKTVGAEAFSATVQEGKGPLEIVAGSFGIPGAVTILAVGAIAATLSVLLNVILGLSRLLLAMARREDMPNFLARLNNETTTPYSAVIIISILISILVLTGSVKVTWSFAAFGGLYRCVIASLAALHLDRQERLYPQFLTWLALLSGLFLAFWIEFQVWLIGLGLIGVGLIWHFLIHRINFNKIKQHSI